MMASKSGSRILRLGVELTGEESYKQGLQKLETGLKNVSAEQKLLNSQFDKGDKSIEKLGRQQDLLKGKLELQKKKMQEIRAEYERVAAVEGENSEAAQKLARDYTYAQAACEKTEKELSELSKEFQTATSRVEQFKAKLKEGENQLERIGKKVSDVGQKLTTRLTLPIAAGATAAIKMFTDFEDEMTVVSTIADETAVSLDDMSAATLKASTDVGTAATELAKAEYQAISAGVDTAEAVDFVTKSAKAAKAGLTDTTTVVDGATSAMNAWKIETGEATTVFDKMITAQNYGKTTLGDIAGQIGNLTGLAPQLGVSLDEVLAATAALTKNGVQTSTAMNGLKNIMAGVLKPTADATKCAEELGLEFNAAALKSKGLTGFLADVVDKTGGSEEALSRLFGSVEGLSSVLLLGKGAAGDYAEALNLIGNSAGAMDEAFEKRTSSKAEQLKKALNALKNEGIKLGQALAPAVELATNALSGLAGVLERMTPEQQQMAITIAAITAGIGPLVLGAGKMVTALGKVKRGFSALSALAGGSGPLGLIIAGIAAATAAIVLLKKHMDGLSKGNQIKAAFSGIAIDNGAIDAAIEKAEAIEYEMELTAKAKLALESDSMTLQGEIIDWLTDGKKETAEQKEEYRAKADEVFQPVFDSVQEAFNEKKAVLDEALAQGLITPEKYAASMEELNATTEDMKTALEKEKQAYVDYVMALANANRKPTEEEIAKLEELRQKVVSVGQEILEATNTALQSAKASYNLAKSGGGTTEDVAVAVKYVQANKGNKLDTAQSLFDSAMAELQKKFDEAQKNGDSEVATQVTLDMQATREGFEEQKAAIEAEYASMMSEIAEGIAAKYPEEAAKIKKIGEEQKLYEELLNAMTELPEAETDAARQKWWDEIKRIYTLATGEEPWGDNYALMAHSAMKALTDGMKKEAQEATDNGEFDAVFTDLSAAIEAGALTGLDMSAVSDTLGSMLTALDLTDDGKTAGEQLIEGEKAGILENQDRLNAAIRDSCEAANMALRDAQGIRSPSTVWKQFGAYMMEGMREGVQGGRAGILAVLNALSGDMKRAGQNAVQGLIDGANAKRSKLVSTFTSVASAALSAAKRKLEVRSPSRAFFRIGENTGEGMIRGLNSKVRAVQSTMQRMVNPDGAAAMGSTQGNPTAENASGGGQTVIQVYYTGAITGRESRRLAQQLGGYMNGQLAAKGR